MNALLSALSTGQNLSNKIMYVTLSPCYQCLKHILQSGIREIYYRELYYTCISKKDDEKEPVKRLILSTDAHVVNIVNSLSYIDDIHESS
jgi:deoxycytidylate deaminase